MRIKEKNIFNFIKNYSFINTLKLITATSLSVSLIFSLSACTKNNNSTSNNNSNTNNSQVDNSSDSEKYSTDIFAMDTYMSLTAYGVNAENAVLEAVHEIQRLDDMFSVGNTTSDVTKLNMSGKENVSDETVYLINKSLEISKKTDGAFDITIYPVMELWSFTTQNYKVPTQNELDDVLQKVDYNNIEVDKNTISLKNNAQIDFGGIAKGYTSTKVIELMKQNGIENAIINLGGNVQTLGYKLDGSQWKVAIQSPDNDGTYIGILKTNDKAVITSGGYERYFEENGKKYHHIIDSKTGYPSDSDLTSVTIICSDGTTADALSTSLFVMGKGKSESFYKNTDIEFDMILVDIDKNVYISEGIQDLFTSDYNVTVVNK